MVEVKLDEGVKEPVAEAPKQLYVIVNEKGLYMKKNKPYWTTDLNKCVSEIRSYNCQVEHARYLLKERKKHDEQRTPCFNTDLFYGFEKLYIKEVKIIEVQND